jgi:Antistasin family/Chaperone of endosialidase
MKRKLWAVSVVILASAPVAACSSSGIIAGEDTGNTAGHFTTGWACACPNSQSTCSLPCPDGTTASCQAGVPTCAMPLDAGACCPAGYDLYACTFPDGGAGEACHNPALGCASSLSCGEGCDPVVTGRCGGSGSDACPGLGCFPNCPNGVLKDQNGCDTCQCAPTDGGNLQWYTTCGYPVCAAPEDGGEFDEAGAACPAVGSPCSQLGDTCGTPSQSNCGATLVCASQDPKARPGGCPISSRKYKTGIEYLDEGQLEELHEEALGIRLATYRYKPQVDDPGPTHLGFIIEDNLQTPAVDLTHNRVDMYGYVSMVVAGMQVQEREIEQLRRELEATRTDLAACKTPAPRAK